MPVNPKRSTFIDPDILSNLKIASAVPLVFAFGTFVRSIYFIFGENARL